MFKNTFFRACAGVLLAAFAFSASAATLSHNFKDDNGNNFSPKNAYVIDLATAGTVKITAQNGTTYSYTDSSGSLAVKLNNYVAAGGAGAGNWYTLPGTAVSVSTTNGLNITCYGSAPVQTAFSYSGGSYTKFVADGCAARTAINGLSN